MAAEDVNSLLSQLAKEIDDEDRDCDTVLDLAERVLAAGASPEHQQEVELCRCVALVNLSKYAECLAALKKLDTSGAHEAAFRTIEAYCLYKTEALDEAIKVAGRDAQEEAMLQIKAQALYRQGRFVEAVTGFKAVKDVLDEDADDAELVSNMMAAYALCGECPELAEEFDALGEQVVEEGGAFELMFNVAAAQVERARYGQAAKSLQATEKCCRETLEEDGFDEEEMRAELGPIWTQLGFVEQRLQQPEEAMAHYQAVLQDKPSDVQVLAVALNNVVTLKGDKELFDSFKKTKAAQTEATELKLTLRQKKAIAFNRALLLLYMNKADQCNDYLRQLETQYPNDNGIGLLRAAILARQSPAKAEAALAEAIGASTDGEHTATLRLSLAQLQIQAGNSRKAIQTLGEIEGLQHRPALLGVLTTLHEAEGNTAQAVAVVQDAIQYWSKKKDGEKEARETVLREGGKYLLRQHQYPAAASAFEQLLKIRKDDPQAVACLVHAYGNFDPEKAEKYAEAIPALEGADEIDAEALEEQTVEAANKGSRRREGGADQDDAEAAAAAAAEAAAKEALAVKRRALRQEKRKATIEKRLPKDLVGTDPATWRPLDPERWLPKRDRSYYKPRRGQKKNPVRGGAQGAAISDAHSQKYDMSDVKKDDPQAAAPSSPPSSPPPQQGKKEKKKKKK